MFSSEDDKTSIKKFQQRMLFSLIFRDEVKSNFVKLVICKYNKSDFIDLIPQFNPSHEMKINLADH